MSAFLMTSCAAALAALRTSAAMFAVALSLSRPSQYHFVSVQEDMAKSFTGSGMGPDGDSGGPIRYEDYAFLTEAFAERGSLGETNVTATTLSSQLRPQAKLFIRKVGEPFVRADLPIDQSFRKSEGFDESDEGWSFAFLGVSNAVPVSSSDELYDSVLKQIQEHSGSYRYTNTLMKAVDSRWFAAAYEDVAKMTRVMPLENWRMIGESTVTGSDYVKLAQVWDGHEFISVADPVHSSSSNYVVSVAFPNLWMWCSCNREKYRVASTSSGKWNEWSNGIVTEGIKYEEKKNVATSDSNGLEFDTGIAALGGRAVKSGVLLSFGRISVSHSFNDSDGWESNTGDFLFGLPVTMANKNGKIVCVAKGFTSEDDLQDIAKRACALYDIPYYKTVTDVLGITKKPDDPNPAERANYYETNEEGSSEYKGKYYIGSKEQITSLYSLELSILAFRLVLDIDFNARTYGAASDGGGSSADADADAGATD